MKIFFVCLLFSFLAASPARPEITFLSPYQKNTGSPIPSINPPSNKIKNIKAPKYSKCPLKPSFLLIDQKTWCKIHKSLHSAVIKQELHEALGYEKAMAIMLGLIQKESSFKINASGKAGEVGLAQIMPSTGKFICNMNKKELSNADSNLNCSAKYLNLLLSKDYFNGDLEKALMAYNQGWGNVKKGIIFDDDIRYARLIIKEYSLNYYFLQ